MVCFATNSDVDPFKAVGVGVAQGCGRRARGGGAGRKEGKVCCAMNCKMVHCFKAAGMGGRWGKRQDRGRGREHGSGTLITH